MLNTKTMQEEILQKKEENDFCILAHAYMSHEITEIADFVGDSYALAKKAMNVKNKNILMCGVRFMAETVKILSPQKNVFLSNPDAGCPMAEQMDRDLVLALKEQNPGYAVVAYINTTAELKTVCDVCVTSSSAVKIIKAMPQKKILFIPDCNLGSFIQKSVKEKEIKLFHGGCPTHARLGIEDVKLARKKHPNALLLVHPECKKEVCELADYVGSTTGIMEFAKESEKKEFIIGTENSICEHLRFECPEKSFFELSKDCICHNMKLTTLAGVLDCVKKNGGEEIFLDEKMRQDAKVCLDNMIKYGG